MVLGSAEAIRVSGTPVPHDRLLGRTEGKVMADGFFSGHGMPNATLCAKAVVEMMLGEENGIGYETICGQLVDRGDLPQSYIITTERIENARRLPTVATQDEAGVIGNQSEEFLEKAKEKRRFCIVM